MLVRINSPHLLKPPFPYSARLTLLDWFLRADKDLVHAKLKLSIAQYDESRFFTEGDQAYPVIDSHMWIGKLFPARSRRTDEMADIVTNLSRHGYQQMPSICQHFMQETQQSSWVSEVLNHLEKGNRVKSCIENRQINNRVLVYISSPERVSGVVNILLF